MPVNIDRRKLQSLGRLELLAKQAVEGFITGMHKSPFHGFSVEFAEHRQYNTGESTRHLDWKLLARTDKHFIKRYEEETNLRCHILLDASPSMYFPSDVKADDQQWNKIKFGIYAAAALNEMMLRQRDATGLTTFSNAIHLNTRAGISAAHRNYLVSILEGLLNEMDNAPKSTSNVASVLHEIADSIHRRSMVIIISDMLDNAGNSEAVFSALQHLRHNKHDVVMFHLADHDLEVNFKYDNRPHTFVDLESNEEIKVNPADIRDAYLERMNEFRKQLRVKAAQYRVDYIDTDIKAGFAPVLMQYLIRRQKMLV
ncbi:MAG: DUF58 domain-containing protein [Flavobacteriales bacterium]